MPDAYLTIDDSPSRDTDRLVDFLTARGVPAIFFVRGAFMEENDKFASIVRAIRQGILIGNHSHAHDRTSVIGLAAQAAQIRDTERLIEKAYRAADAARPGKYIRFPHMDRGMGGWIVDFDTVPADHRAYVESLFWDGLRVETTARPPEEQFTLRARMQDWLRQEGFAQLPTPGVAHPWFMESEMAEAVDAMYTFSTSDWMLTPRHKGNWPYKTLDDLRKKIDEDAWLQRADSAHIVLAHDDREDSLGITSALIDHMRHTGFRFLPMA
jgi:peptidoglycan-N-acetylglucosamine deacetylase